jgi:AbrB family looped-hinge helix DNA binding protein
MRRGKISILFGKEGSAMIRRVSKKGSVQIPIELRARYHLYPGTAVEIVDNGGILTIVPKTDKPEADQGEQL